MSASLVLGGVELNEDEASRDWRFEVLGEDVTFGNPQPVEVSIASLMADGSVTVRARDENREAGFRVQVTATNSAALARGEAALDARLRRRTSLEWTPADGFGPTTVFDVETSNMEWLFDDIAEAEGKALLRRTFRLRLACLPFARSAEATSVGSVFVPAAVAIADECESTAGWTDKFGNQVQTIYSVDSTAGNFVTGTGAIKARSLNYAYDDSAIDQVYGTGRNDVDLRKTGLSINATSGGYLVMWLRSDWPTWSIVDAFITTSGGGRQAVNPLVAEKGANGFTRLAFVIPHHSTVTAFDLKVKQQIQAPGQSPPQPFVRVDSIGLAAAADSANQAIRSFEVGGSARTEADITVSAVAGLEDVLIYTTPDVGDGFNPAMRRWLTNGTATNETTAINGSYVTASNSEASALVFKPPAAMLRAGQYSVLVRCKYVSSGTGSVSLTFAGNAQLEVNGTPVGPVETITATAQTIEWGNDRYYVLNAGSVYLPPVTVDPTSTALVRLKLWVTNAASLRVDEVAVFPQDESALTWVRCGFGSPGADVSSRVWLPAPSPSNPRPGVLAGNDPYRLDARGKTPMARGRHLLNPGRMLVYLMTGVAGGADLSFTYYKRWHSNAAE